MAAVAHFTDWLRISLPATLGKEQQPGPCPPWEWLPSGALAQPWWYWGVGCGPDSFPLPSLKAGLQGGEQQQDLMGGFLWPQFTRAQDGGPPLPGPEERRVLLLGGEEAAPGRALWALPYFSPCCQGTRLLLTWIPCRGPIFHHPGRPVSSCFPATPAAGGHREGCGP